MAVNEIVAEYQREVLHLAEDKIVRATSRVYLGGPDGSYRLAHSHTFRPVEGAKAWASDSYSYARTLAEAESMIEDWFRMLANSYEIVVWDLELR